MSATHTPTYTDIVFDGPPSHDAPRFVEIENVAGASFKFGRWVQRADGYWCLRFTPAEAAPELAKTLRAFVVDPPSHLSAAWFELCDNACTALAKAGAL